MTLVMPLLVGVLFAAGTFLVLRRDLVRVVWGLGLYSQAANLIVLTVGGVSPAQAPIVDGGGPTMDPLVQALVLTAIVIGLGVTTFALVLTYRVYEENASVNADNVSGQDDLFGLRWGEEP